MASTAYTFFCFEVLAASYSKGSHPSLRDVLDAYDKTQHTMGQADRDPAGPLGEDHENDGHTVGERTRHQPPSIARIQAQSGDTGSTTSTPLSASSNSSTSQLTNSTATDSSLSPSYASRLSVTASYPIFVTWDVISRSGHKHLRGCIGTFENLPLEQGLAQYSLTSAFEDTRFSPIPASLLPNLACSITLLADFEECKDPMDWDLGKHGIRISFLHRNRRYGATYLPQVAIEQGWTKEETLDSLMRKAGHEPATRHLSRKTSSPWEHVENFQVVRYAGLKADSTYSEWQNWRKTTGLSSS